MHGVAERESLDKGLTIKCKPVDQAMTALVKDLKQRGLLDETLVVWGGEFGRTPMQENRGGREWPFKRQRPPYRSFSGLDGRRRRKRRFLPLVKPNEIGYYGIKR